MSPVLVGMGSIVLLSSVSSASAAGYCIPYAASKGAVDALGWGLSQEVARDGIRVNVVSPGLIDTEIQPVAGGERRTQPTHGPSWPTGGSGESHPLASIGRCLLCSAAISRYLTRGECYACLILGKTPSQAQHGALDMLSVCGPRRMGLTSSSPPRQLNRIQNCRALSRVRRRHGAAGGSALAVRCDIRDEKQIEAAVAQAVETFGGIDICVNNASAISMTDTPSTPMRRYDLMHQINARGTFATTQACLPHLMKAENPHVLTLASPINLDPKWFAKYTAYTMAKYGMSLCVIGHAAEFRQYGIAVNGLWPATLIATGA